MERKMEKNSMPVTEYAYDVSVVVLTYNGLMPKIQETLHSILMQKDVRWQLIVADDGSRENHFEEISAFLTAEGITEYLLLSAEKNQGTVRNALQAARRAEGEYIKLISPGDSLHGSDCLSSWLKAVRSAGTSWSFSDAIYYREENGEKTALQAVARPVMTKPYLRNQINKMRWAYAVVGDVAVGAAILCRTDCMRTYLERIEGKVIYAEDYIYKLMMFDGVVGTYYPRQTVLYECASGISSSSNDVWTDRLDHDLKAVREIMIGEQRSKDPLQLHMVRALKKTSQRRGWRGPFCRGELRFILIKKFFPRRTKYVDLAEQGADDMFHRAGELS